MAVLRGTVRSVLMFSCAAGLCLSAAGEIIMQADFKDPANPVTKGGTGVLVNWLEGAGVIKDGFLEVTQQKGERPGLMSAIKITPESPATSMEAMFKDGKLNGAMDFFVSSSLGIADEDFPDCFLALMMQKNNANGGLNLSLMNYKNDLRVEIIGPEKTSSLISTHGAAYDGTGFNSRIRMEPDKVYHFAITFQTDDSGLVTGKLYFVPAGQDIIPDKDKPVSTHSFKFGPAVKAGFGTDAVIFGQMYTFKEFKEKFTNRFGRLTIYNSVPPVFPKL